VFDSVDKNAAVVARRAEGQDAAVLSSRWLGLREGRENKTAI
jgi:hypothetical protein